LIRTSVPSIQKPRPLRTAGAFACDGRAGVTYFHKIVRNAVLRRCVAANDRETGKKGDPTAIPIDFPDFPDVVLSYQAWPIPRIVPRSDKPVSRDRPIVIVFNPAETT
jgi:hypothetical protein